MIRDSNPIITFMNLWIKVLNHSANIKSENSQINFGYTLTVGGQADGVEEG